MRSLVASKRDRRRGGGLEDYRLYDQWVRDLFIELHCSDIIIIIIVINISKEKKYKDSSGKSESNITAHGTK